MKITKRKIIMLAVIAGVFVILITIQLFKPKLTVKTYTVKYVTIEEIVSSLESGTLEPVRKARLKAETTGRVKEIVRKEGERVKKGEVIIRIANDDLLQRVNLQKSNLLVQKARVQVVEGNLKNLREKLEKLKKLYEEGVVSETQLKDIETQYNAILSEYNAALSAVEQGESLLKIAELELKKTEIVSPFDGLITEINVREGENLGSISVPEIASRSVSSLESGGSFYQGITKDYVCEVIDDSELHVEAPFDERDAMQIKEGFPVRLSSDAYEDRIFNGKVLFVSPAVSGVSGGLRSVKVRASVDRPLDLQLIPGMSMDVDVIVRTVSNTLIIPTNAMIDREGDYHVFVLDGKKARLKKVEIGISNWEWAEVKNGLKNGDRIIISLDNTQLKDGVRVKEENE